MSRYDNPAEDGMMAGKAERRAERDQLLAQYHRLGRDLEDSSRSAVTHEDRHLVNFLRARQEEVSRQIRALDRSR